MQAHGVFWKLEALSNRQLLERLGSVLGSSRRLMAELVAHLGEVEVRRLHLVAACSSMFAYCLKLGMTEDEAYRRIEVARLARRYPAIFPLLANGQLSLSVVALLRHHLSEENHLELLAAVTKKSVAQTRELIAARFPRPDVPSSVRKLPERRPMAEPSLALSTPPENASETESGSGVTTATEVPASAAPVDVMREGGSTSFAPAVNAARATAAETPTFTDVQRVAPPLPPDVQRAVPPPPPDAQRASSPPPPDAQRASTPPPPDAQRVAETSAPTNTQRAAPPSPPSRIDPLSAQRYKVQFTGSAELARKLELAKDLMRHSQPGGELGPIVERALDLLIESLMQRRFGKKASPKRTSACTTSMGPEPRSDVTSDRSRMRAAAELSTTLADAPTPHHAPTPDTAAPTTSTKPKSAPPDPATPPPEPAPPKPPRPESAPPSAMTPGPAPSDSAPPPAMTPEPAAPEPAPPVAAPVPGEPVTPGSTPPESADDQVAHRGELTRASVSSYIPRSTRRAVVERDGLGCSWVDEHGVRCGSRAWLEYDHRHPRAKGGGSEPHNVRLICRSHNRFAAERAYGRKHVEQAIGERRGDQRCT